MLSLEQYQKKKALLADPSKEISDDARAKVQAALDEYDNSLAGAKYSGEAPLAEGESLRVIPQARRKGPLEGTEEEKVQSVVAQLDPSFPLLPQVLASQPATTHAQGDSAAADEWLKGDLQNPNGTVVCYDLPVAEVRKKLFENPALYKALGGGFAVPEKPEDIMNIQSGGAVHQAFNDYYWNMTANSAIEAGKTAYRYSKAPWVKDGKAGETLQNLRVKFNMMPIDAPTAFVLGYDDTAQFGALRAAQEAHAGPAPAAPVSGAQQGWQQENKITTAGGTPEGISAQERNDSFREDHPTAYGVGQGVGVLNPFSLVNRLMGWLKVGGTSELGKTAIKAAAQAGFRGAAGGAAEQTVKEGAQAASSLAATGDTGTTAMDAGKRIGAAALGMAVPTALGGGIRGMGGEIAEAVERGPRYKGAPGRLKTHGVETEIGKGHVTPPIVAEAAERGRAAGGMSALGVLANDLQSPLSTAARAPAPNGRAAPATKANSPQGARRAVMRAGRSRGEDPNIPLLQGVARRAGGAAPEQLRGALVARDLAQLEGQARFGRPGMTGLAGLLSLLHPGAAALALGSVADKAVLKGIYPATQALEKLPAGAAAKIGRAAGNRAVDTVDDRDEERRKKRDEKSAAGFEGRAKEAGAGKKKDRKERAYRAKPRKEKMRREEATAEE